MRKTTAALAVSMLTLTMALPAAAKPVYDDTLVLRWDGNSITYANGEVTFDVNLQGMVDCAGTGLWATERWTGTVPASLDLKNSLRTATLSFDTFGLGIAVDGGCDVASAAVPASIAFDVVVDGATERWRDPTGRTLQRTGLVLLPLFGGVEVKAELTRVVSR